MQAINKALFERVKACTLCPVYDSVPDNKKMPYIALADTELTPWNTKTTAGLAVTAGILLYSDYKGDKQINEMADAVMGLFDKAPLNLGEGLPVVKQQLEALKIDRLDGFREGFIKITIKIHKR